MDARDRLLRALEELTECDLRTFAYYLSDTVPRGKLERASPVDLAEILLRHHPDTAAQVAAQILEKIPRRDLLGRLLRRGGGDPGEEEEAATTGRMEEEEEMACEPNPNFVARSRQISDQDLMKVAGKMGNKWRQIAIQYLGVESSRLEQIEEENPGNAPMRAFYTLLDWKNREKTRATASHLYTILNQDGVQLDYTAYDFLKQST